MGVVGPDPPAPPVASRVVATEATARRLHRRGIEATSDGRPAAGARHLRTGLAQLGWHEHDGFVPQPGSTRDAVVARLLISLAYAESELGRTDYGFDLLTAAEPLVDPDDNGVLLSQRALMLYRTGRYTDAMRFFDEAIPWLGAERHVAVLCSTLLNRASVHLHAGRVSAARADLRRCEQLARRHRLGMLAAKAIHNRGYCELLAGHLPASLEAFAAAESLYREHAPGYLPVLHAARARALLTAGLPTEAGRTLDDVITASRRQRLTQEQAEAELLRAQAALRAGDHAVASAWARRAERRFRRRSNAAWAELAALARLRSDLPRARRLSALAARARTVAVGLRAVQLLPDAEMADLVGVRALVAAGRADLAAALVATIPRTPPPTPIELHLMRRLARAELAWARGDRTRTATEIRVGLSTLQQHRSRLGSVDLQASIATLGRELATMGLDRAFDRGSAMGIFSWSERSRAQAFQIPPVHPPADPQAAEAIAELRQLRHGLRTAERGHPDTVLARARCAELERLIRERTWRVGGPRQSQRAARPADVLAELAATDRTLVSFLARAGRLEALLVDSGRVRLLPLGEHAAAREATARLLADLDVLAAGGLPGPIEDVIHASLRRNLRTVAEHVIRPMEALLGDRDLVLVPTMELSSIPWGLLPAMRGRPVTVAASASAWLAAQRSARSTAERAPAGRPFLVAGPGLRFAEAEIDEVARAHPGSRTLAGPDATVASTLGGLDGASIAHLAAHGHHERENVLFSCLDLVDGPLMAYDIEQLKATPRQVSLSACDVGRAVVRPGDEILGFTAALLYAGTESVVSSVATVSHPGAVAVMTRYHRALAAGVAPSRALADASYADPIAPFVCFGAG
ncbi:CHAT domain-containing protein [Asanoa hainanensis]|nr:CHAT domain-containing protein [Asanoa hainanensis]